MTPNSNEIKTAIKAAMKRKGLTYHDLAAHLEVSHATVKRILTSEEITLGRLLAICEWLGFSLSELETMAEVSATRQAPVFTLEQEEFLAADARYLVFLLHLYEESNPQKVAEEFDLNQESIDKYLLELEKHDLIRVTGSGRVRTQHRIYPHWIRGGPLALTHYRALLTTFSRFFVERTGRIFAEDFDAISRPKDYGNVTCMPLTEKSAAAMREEMDELNKRWARVSNLEAKMEDSDQLGNAASMSAFAWIPDDSEVAELENVFGTVERIR